MLIPKKKSAPLIKYNGKKHPIKSKVVGLIFIRCWKMYMQEFFYFIKLCSINIKSLILEEVWIWIRIRTCGRNQIRIRIGVFFSNPGSGSATLLVAQRGSAQKEGQIYLLKLSNFANVSGLYDCSSKKNWDDCSYQIK